MQEALELALEHKDIELWLPLSTSASEFIQFRAEMLNRLFSFEYTFEQGRLLVMLRCPKRVSLYTEDLGEGAFRVHTQSCAGNGNRFVELLGSKVDFDKLLRSVGIYIGEGGDIPF